MKGLLSLYDGNVVACDTPKSKTHYMFCSSCEGILSQHGETQFVPHFFDKLNNVALRHLNYTHLTDSHLFALSLWKLCNIQLLTQHKMISTAQNVN